MPPAFIECVKFETQTFSVEFCRKWCDVKEKGGGGVKILFNVIMMLIFHKDFRKAFLVYF